MIENAISSRSRAVRPPNSDFLIGFCPAEILPFFRFFPKLGIPPIYSYQPKKGVPLLRRSRTRGKRELPQRGHGPGAGRGGHGQVGHGAQAGPLGDAPEHPPDAPLVRGPREEAG